MSESQKEVRAILGGRVVTDGVYYYSNLAVAYPVSRGTLHGLVEWNFEGDRLQTISLKIVDFQVAPPVLSAELERTLPGCRPEEDDDDSQAVDEDIPENEWTCLTEGRGEQDVLVDVYFSPDLVMLELGP